VDCGLCRVGWQGFHFESLLKAHPNPGLEPLRAQHFRDIKDPDIRVFCIGCGV